MTFLRTAYKILALVIWSVILVPMTFPCRLFGRSGLRANAAITRLWIYGAARIANLTVRVHGRLPETGALIVSNHISYLDGVAEGALLKLRWATRSDIAHWPAVGLLVAASGTIWVDRTTKSAAKKTLMEFRETLASGLCLLVWPEGTSTDGNNGVLPFKSTAFEAVADTGFPVYPVLIKYDQPEVPWYGDMYFFPNFIKILGLPALSGDVYFLEPILPEGRSRKELAEHVQKIMDNEYRRLKINGER